MTYLDRIIAAHREASTGGQPPGPLVDQAVALPATRGFRRALAAQPSRTIGVIAEIKRRSPSKGDLAPDLDPGGLAAAYEAGGATCLSVLTDVEFFGGSRQDLAAARAASALPVLRKDFTVSALDVVETRLMGADAVLLIVAALAQAELRDHLAMALHVGLDALVEVHDEADLDRAVDAGADLIGVNQRDLVTFEVDTARAVRLARRLGELTVEAVVAVAESGIRGAADASALRRAGYRAVLVGESLVTADDPVAAVADLRRGQ